MLANLIYPVSLGVIVGAAFGLLKSSTKRGGV